jgi:hypothetical protein
MAAALPCHQLDDDAGLAVPPRAKDYAFVAPVHMSLLGLSAL